MASTYTMVGYGSQGESVRRLQSELNKQGYQLDEDGVFGEKTRAAVRDYQKKNSLKRDGIAGDETWGSLMSASASAAEEPQASVPKAAPSARTAKALAELEELEAQQRKAALPALEVEPYTEEKVDFDTFCKSDLRAVKIKNCEPVKKSDKLLKFTLDDGSGTDRVILSGIRHYYEPEQLIGKTAVAILNLPPRKMMGIPSCGMLISAVHKERGEEKLHLLLLDDAIPAGAKLC